MSRAGRVGERGSASVEYVALVALIGLVAIAAIAALVAGPSNDAARELGRTIGRRIVCAPKLPGPCRRDPLALAYGFPLAKLVRALAPAPSGRAGADGTPLVGVDFRYCRRPSCAIPASGTTHLTSAGRRPTAFTSVNDLRRSGGAVEISYWLYRPGLGWERIVRRATRADLAAAGFLRLRQSDDPALVPLETLPGRNHYRFPPSEEPPWRWRVPARYPG
jgi:hypothetical protein